MTDDQHPDEIARLETVLERLEAIGMNLDAEVDPQVAVGAGGYPGNIAAGELIEAAWGNAVVSSFFQHVRAVWIPGLGANQPLAQTQQYASQAAVLTNNRAGSTAIVIASVGISTSVAGSAATIAVGYTPPGGGVTSMPGSPAVAYMPNTISQMSLPVLGFMTLPAVGAYQFYLTGTSSTLNATVISNPYTGGLVMIIGG